MPISLKQIVDDFAWAFKKVDESKPQGRSKTRTYRFGIGSLTEDEAVKQALGMLAEAKSTIYSSAKPRAYPGTRQKCDLVIPNEWAIEFKLIRPFGDNGKEAEHWSENVLHPYEGNTSAVGDCIKLIRSGFPEKKAVIVFGYEHEHPQISLEPAIRSFEILATEVANIDLGQRHTADFTGLLHPVHQRGRIFAWEVHGFRAPSQSA